MCAYQWMINMKKRTPIQYPYKIKLNSYPKQKYTPTTQRKHWTGFSAWRSMLVLYGQWITYGCVCGFTMLLLICQLCAQLQIWRLQEYTESSLRSSSPNVFFFLVLLAFNGTTHLRCSKWNKENIWSIGIRCWLCCWQFQVRKNSIWYVTN